MNINSKLVDQIIKNKLPCFFVSPHLDDAALSAGELMAFLAKKTKVTVINVFTNVDTRGETLSAQKAVKDAGYSEAKAFYKDRIKEDNNAYKSLGVKVVNLNFVEALWRKNSEVSGIKNLLANILPEFSHVYPTYRLHIAKGQVAKADFQTIDQISLELKKLIPANGVVFCPIGVGEHVDHLATRKAVEKRHNPIFWLDQPYDIRKKSKGQINADDLDLAFEFPVNKSSKEKLLKHYKNQINLLFGKKQIPLLREQFFNKKLAQTSLPLKVGEYRLIKEILDDKTPRHFTYGLYENNKSQKAFAKQWVGETHDQYYQWLRNEIQTYTFLENIIKQDSNFKTKSADIYLPKMIATSEEESNLLLLLEYIEGKHLVNFENSFKEEVYTKLFNFFAYLNSKITANSQLINRSNWFWTAIFPVVCLKAILKNPTLIGLIIKSAIVFGLQLPNLLFNQRKGFVHRDLADWNVLVKGSKIMLYDFQLSCIADPVLEYVVTDLKTWKVGKKSNFFFNLMKSEYPEKFTGGIYRALAICLAIYDLGMNEGGVRNNAIDFLKYQTEVKRDGKSYFGNWLEWLKRDIYLFWQTPKNYLFMLTLPKDQTVKMDTYDPNLEKIAHDVIKKVHTINPKLKVHFIGSARLHIVGQKDVDLFVESPAKNFDRYLPAFTKQFGKPQKRRKQFVEWSFKVEGCTVELSLVDPKDQIYQSRLKVFYALQKNKELKQEYEDLKKSLNNYSIQEYTRMRMEFFLKVERMVSYKKGWNTK